jgi:hypothetical protein
LSVRCSGQVRIAAMVGTNDHFRIELYAPPCDRFSGSVPVVDPIS